MPCCLPKQALGIAPAEVYESKRDTEQYAAWAAHLEARLRRGGHTVARSEAKCMLSCKNELITAMKRHIAQTVAVDLFGELNRIARPCVSAGGRRGPFVDVIFQPVAPGFFTRELGIARGYVLIGPASVGVPALAVFSLLLEAERAPQLFVVSEYIGRANHTLTPPGAPLATTLLRGSQSKAKTWHVTVPDLS
eukprot:2263033-Prymnesium_polylepis.1